MRPKETFARTTCKPTCYLPCISSRRWPSPISTSVISQRHQVIFLVRKQNVAEKLDETAICPLELAKTRFHKKTFRLTHNHGYILRHLHLGQLLHVYLHVHAHRMRVNLRLNMNHMRQSKSHSCDDVMSRVRAAHSAVRSITATAAEPPRLSSRHCVYRCQRSWRMRQGWSLCGCDSMTLSWRVIAVTALVIQEQHEREQNNWIQDQLHGNATI